MFLTIKNILDKNHFLTSSTLVFMVNLINGLMNYGLVIFASRYLLEDYSLWTALTGFMSILIAPMTGFMTEFTKNCSALDKSSHQKGYDYYQFVQSRAGKLDRVILVLSIIIFISIFSQVIPKTYIISSLILGYSLLNINANVSNQYFMSTFSFKNYSFTILATNLARFLPTVLMLFFGFGIYSLPTGLFIAVGINIIVGKFLIKQFAKQNKLQNNQFRAFAYNSSKQLKSASLNIIILLCIMVYFNIAPIISELAFPQLEQDLFAVIYNFGQIIHFGSIAFLSTLVTYASRGKSSKIYYTSVAVILLLTFSISGSFYIFAPIMLQILKRSQYLGNTNLIMLYSVFIAFFNVLFVSVQYLISHNQYKLLRGLPVLTIAMVVGSYLAAIGKVQVFGDSLVSFINICIFFTFLSAIYYIWQVRKFNKKPKN